MEYYWKERTRTAFYKLSEVYTDLRGLKNKSHSFYISVDNDKKFKEMSFELGSLLPKISQWDIFEIDDLIYSEQIPTMKNLKPCGESIKYLTEYCFNYFNRVYAHLKVLRTHLEYKCSPNMNPIVDMAFLQLLAGASGDTFKSYFEYPRSILWIVSNLSYERNVVSVCLALKILRVVLETRKIFQSDTQRFENGYLFNLMWIKKFKNIPEAKHHDKKRITSWISKQSAAIFEIMQMELYLSLDEYLISTQMQSTSQSRIQEDNMKTYINRLFFLTTNIKFNNTIILEQLYSYFTCAQTEDEKFKLMEYFLKGSQMKSPYATINKSQTEKLIENKKFIVKCFASFCYHRTHSESYTNIEIKEIEKYYVNEFEPYLSENKSSDDVEIWNVTENDSVCSNIKKDTFDKPDHTIEIFLYYGEFMKYIYVLTIVFTAYMKFPEFLKENSEAGVRYPFLDHCKKTFRNVIKNPYSADIPWWMLNLVKKCPFIFIPRHQQYLNKDLVKMVEGKEVDKLRLEKLYFALF